MNPRNMKPFQYMGWDISLHSGTIINDHTKYIIKAQFDYIVISKVPNDYSDARLMHLKFLHRENHATDEIINEGYDLDKCIEEIKAQIDKIGEREKIIFPKDQYENQDKT